MASNDFLIRQIENATRFLAKMIFTQEDSTYDMIDEQGVFSQAGFLYLRLKAMLQEGDINGAEEFLFDAMHEDETGKLAPIALRFYETLQQLSDEELAKCDFSRQEIAQGLEMVVEHYKQ